MAEEKWPTTIEGAVERVIAALDDKSKEEIRNAKKADLVLLHHGLETWIRSGLGLWKGNLPLAKSRGSDVIYMSDAVSTAEVIIEAVWKELRKNKKRRKG